MPVALIVRLLVRIAASLLFWRFATARRGASRGRTRPVPEASASTRLDARRRMTALRDSASLAGRAVTLAALLIVTALGVAAGVGPTVLGPRWLGIALLVVATAALTGAIVEALAMRRLFAARSRRHHDRELTKQVYP